MTTTKYLTIYLITTLLLSMGACDNKPKTVYVKDYLTDETTKEDAYPAIRAALEECIKNGGGTLVLPGGILPIKDKYCYEKFQFISNNDEGGKRIAFELDGVENLTIDGNGTTLLFTGFISPFNMENCKNISIKDLTIDFTRTFYSQGTIIDKGEDWLELKFPDDYQIDLTSDVLRFRSSDGTYYPYASLLEFDYEKREVAHYVHDYWLWGPGLKSEKCDNGNYRIYLKGLTGTIGNVMVFGAKARLNPGFTLDDCSDINLANINLFHCCGMGVIAQRTNNIELNNIKIIPTPESNRIISITADATHFINCGGYLRMVDCLFTNQKDDATNIHGWYAIVREKLDDNKLLLWVNYGKDFARSGMKMELVDNKTMMTYGYATVKSVKKINSELSEVIFEEKLPEQLKIQDAIASDDQYPEVLINGCYFANNRARGLLIGSRGKTVIKDNYFHTPGAAILFEGDGNYWYEQSGVRDVTIANNTFDNCLYGCSSWGKAVIAVGSGIPEKEKSRYHQNVKIRNNIFRSFDPRILNLYCVDGVVFEDNTIEATSDYTYARGETMPFIINDCDNVTLQ